MKKQDILRLKRVPKLSITTDAENNKFIYSIAHWYKHVHGDEETGVQNF